MIRFLIHPLLILTYILLLMLAMNPYAFGVNGLGDKRSVLLLVSVFSTTCLIPGIGIVLMKPLGMVKNLEMDDKQDRIGPFIITGVFYLWLFKNFQVDGGVPLVYTRFVLGATIGLFLTFFINIFRKISIYAAGMGALLTMVLILAFAWPGRSLDMGMLQVSMNVVLAVVMLLAGALGYYLQVTGRHTAAEVWQGYAAGCVSVLIGYGLM